MIVCRSSTCDSATWRTRLRQTGVAHLRYTRHVPVCQCATSHSTCCMRSTRALSDIRCMLWRCISQLHAVCDTPSIGPNHTLDWSIRATMASRRKTADDADIISDHPLRQLLKSVRPWHDPFPSDTTMRAMMTCVPARVPVRACVYACACVLLCTRISMDMIMSMSKCVCVCVLYACGGALSNVCVCVLTRVNTCWFHGANRWVCVICVASLISHAMAWLMHADLLRSSRWRYKYLIVDVCQVVLPLTWVASISIGVAAHKQLRVCICKVHDHPGADERRKVNAMGKKGINRKFWGWEARSLHDVITQAVVCVP